MSLILTKPWTRQPQYSVPLNPSSPIGSTPEFLWTGIYRDRELVKRNVGTINAGGLLHTIGPGGLAGSGNGSFASVYWDAANYTASTNYTVFAYVLDNAGRTSVRNPLDADRVDAQRFFQLRFTTSSFVEFIPFNTSGSAFTATGTLASPSNTPCLIVGRVENGAVSVWLNGSLQGSNTLTGTAYSTNTPSGGTNRFALGALARLDANPFTGQIYLAGYFARALTNAQICALAANPWALFAPLPRRIFATATVGGTTNGAGSLSASGTIAGTGSSTFSGVGSLAASGTIAGVGEATFAGAGSLAATGTLSGVGESTFSGVGSLSATGTITAVGEDAGSAVSSGVGTLSATGAISGVGQSTFSGVGLLSASGDLAGIGADAISAAVGILSASGTLVGVSDVTVLGGGYAESYQKRLRKKKELEKLLRDTTSDKRVDVAESQVLPPSERSDVGVAPNLQSVSPDLIPEAKILVAKAELAIKSKKFKEKIQPESFANITNDDEIAMAVILEAILKGLN